jgi:transposase InsO family protein
MKDSLWSVDLFRCESAILRTHWVLVVMDQYTREIIGFGMQAGIVDGMSLCRMFQQAIGRRPVPKYLSSDNDPLFRFQQWQANLRVLEVEEIKTAPYAPLSHPFVERLIGTIRHCSVHVRVSYMRSPGVTSPRAAVAVPKKLSTHNSIGAQYAIQSTRAALLARFPNSAVMLRRFCSSNAYRRDRCGQLHEQDCARVPGHYLRI